MRNSLQISAANQAHPDQYWHRFAVAIVRDGEVQPEIVTHELTFQEAEKLASELDVVAPLSDGRTYQVLPPGGRADVMPAAQQNIDVRWAVARKADDHRFIASFKRRLELGIEYVSLADCERFRALA